MSRCRGRPLGPSRSRLRSRCRTRASCSRSDHPPGTARGTAPDTGHRPDRDLDRDTDTGPDNVHQVQVVELRVAGRPRGLASRHPGPVRRRPRRRPAHGGRARPAIRRHGSLSVAAAAPAEHRRTIRDTRPAAANDQAGWPDRLRQICRLDPARRGQAVPQESLSGPELSCSSAYSSLRRP